MVKRNSFLRGLNRFLSTGFYTGYFPVMPGTAGSLVGAAIYVFLSPFTVVYPLFLVLFIILSVIVSDHAEKVIFRYKDPSFVVIDEIGGMLVAMAGIPFHFNAEGWFYLAAGFLLFRVLDIWKPFPIRQSQKLDGGLGIVMDDLLAGLFTNLVLQFLKATNLIRF